MFPANQLRINDNGEVEMNRANERPRYQDIRLDAYRFDERAGELAGPRHPIVSKYKFN